MNGVKRPYWPAAPPVMLWSMTLVNRFVSALLGSPLHRLMSGSVDLVRYTGRRSGNQFTTPTQYARDGDDMVVLVADPDAKSWWRNFQDGRAVDVLVRGQWRPMTDRVVVAADEAELAIRLLEAYLRRFPKAARGLGEGSTAQRAERAVIVFCQPA